MKKKLRLKTTNVIVSNCIEKKTIEGRISDLEVLYQIPSEMVNKDCVCVESFYFGIFDEEGREIEEWWKWMHGLESFPERNILDMEYQINLKPDGNQYEEFSFTIKFVLEGEV